MKKTILILVLVLALSLLIAGSAMAQSLGEDEAPRLATIDLATCQESYAGPGPGVRYCFPDWTGRWIQTYLRQGQDHWVTKCLLYVPEYIDNEKDAQAWRWPDDILADLCSLEDEPQTWTGIYLHTEKETVEKCKTMVYTNGLQ